MANLNGDSARRIVLHSMAVVGNGMGAILTGLISDLLARQFGDDALRLALFGMVCMLIPAIASFYLASKSYPAALQRANLNITT